ncbi:MAG TPA: HAMP domain-containing protein [Candidatus Nanoarchaeia archaeon]|nr:HAMP domain-containing protein [Candidatus Nanoarchaeia archaeon]
MHSLKYKILLLTLVPLALSLLIIGGLSVYNKIGTERELLLGRLNAYRILLESGDLAFETSTDKVKLESLLDEKVEFSEIIDRNYFPIYSSENSVAPLITDEEKKDIDEAFDGIETTKNIGKENHRNAAFVIISPLIVNYRVVAVLHQGLSNEKSSQRVMDYILYILVFIVMGIAICFILISLLLNKLILRDIYQLKKSTIEIQKGNLDAKIEVNSKDEIGELAGAFESMRLAIKKQQDELEGYSKNLERKVEDRTQELRTKNEELEKFNKIAVGRELKMLELKNKIAELEGGFQKKE